jgi:hypothetical protein
MLIRIAAIAFVALSVAIKWGDLPHPDTHALQGAWEIVSVERDGKGDPAPVGMSVGFVGDEAHFQVPLDRPMVTPTTKPRALNAEELARLSLR